MWFDKPIYPDWAMQSMCQPKECEEFTHRWQEGSVWPQLLGCSSKPNDLTNTIETILK